jgi:hypothetical protein
MYLCVIGNGIDCTSFYDFSIIFWKFSDSVVFFVSIFFGIMSVIRLRCLCLING